MTRYATQTGHHCSRRFGWDCHGLPIEYEIDKRDGIKSSVEREAVSQTLVKIWGNRNSNQISFYRSVSKNIIEDVEKLS